MEKLSFMFFLFPFPFLFFLSFFLFLIVVDMCSCDSGAVFTLMYVRERMLFFLVQICLELWSSVKALKFWSFLSRTEAQKYFHMKYQHEESLWVNFSLTTFVTYAASPETEAYRGNVIKSSHIASQWQMQKCSLSFLILDLKPFQLNRRN